MQCLVLLELIRLQEGPITVGKVTGIILRWTVQLRV